MRLCVPEFYDNRLVLEVTQRVAKRSHGHGMDVFT